MEKTDHIIWSDQIDYEDWREDMESEYPDENEQWRIDRAYAINDSYLDDERCNLDEEVDGVIVAFADLGLWNGRTNGARIEGTNVKDILHSNCDYVDWYCDRYNVRCDAIHHDGRNHYLYRVAKDREQAERLVNKIAYGGMTEEQFMKATRSLRTYVAKEYGF